MPNSSRREFLGQGVLGLGVGLDMLLHNPRAKAVPDISEVAWSTLKGRIVWADGEIPRREPVNVNARVREALNGKQILSEDWVVHEKNKGVRWVLVWLQPEPGKQQPLPIHPSLNKIAKQEVTLKQVNFVFAPHVMGIREGQTLLIKNASDEAHSASVQGDPLRNPPCCHLLPSEKELRLKELRSQKLPLAVSCKIHHWMTARVGVFAHPYFAVTDENGAFEIPLAPKGEWRLMIWHESVGWRLGVEGKDGEKVSIKDQKVTDVGNLGLKPHD